MPRVFKGFALVLVIGLAFGCKKSQSKVSWDDVDRPSSVEQNRAAAASLAAPPMFASVPADTPYVFAAFTPFPAAYWKRACEELCPVMEKALAQGASMAASDRSQESRLAAAVMGELRGHLSADGLRQLGLSAEPRFAFYGLGATPVFRIEVGDPAVLAATIKRIEQKSGMTLPTRTVGTQSYWYAADADGAIAAAITGKELVVVAGGPAAVDRAVPILFGGEKLTGPTMADGATLKKLAADYGFAGYGLGYVDFKRLAAIALGDDRGIHGEMWRLAHGSALGADAGSTPTTAAAAPPDATSARRPSAGAPAAPPAPMRLPDPDPDTGAPDPDQQPDPDRQPDPPPLADADAGVPQQPVDPAACKTAVAELTRRFPRLVVGYDEVSDKRASFSATLEADADTVALIKAMQVRSPGVSTRIPGAPLVAVGAAVDVKAAEKLMAVLEPVTDRLSGACGMDSLFDDDGEDGDDDDDADLTSPLAGVIPGMDTKDLTGGMVVLMSGKLSTGLPEDLEGYAVLGLKGPEAVRRFGDLLGMAGVKDFAPDGKYRALDLGGLGPMASMIKRPVKVAGRDDAVVVAAGDRARGAVDTALGQTGGSSPLVIFAYDVGRVAKGMGEMFDMTGRRGSAGDDPMDRMSMMVGKEMLDAEARLFGLVVMAIRASDRGLGMIIRMDLK